MEQPVSLREAERRVFRTTLQHGLWDVLIGMVFVSFAVAPYLSGAGLGDFWASLVFLPFWAGVYIALWAIKKKVVIPRMGVVQFGPERKARLMRWNIISCVLLTVALVLGCVAAGYFGVLPGSFYAISLGISMLAVFGFTAYFLDCSRFYLYGLMAVSAPAIGEWLSVHMKVPHHGFPVTFGITAGVIILTGTIKFIRFVGSHPVPREEPSPQE